MAAAVRAGWPGTRPAANSLSRSDPHLHHLRLDLDGPVLGATGTSGVCLMTGHDRTPVVDADEEIAAAHLENLDPFGEIGEIALQRILIAPRVNVPQRRRQQLAQRGRVAVSDRIASSLFELQKLIDRTLIAFGYQSVGSSSSSATTRDGAALARLIFSGKHATVNPVAGSASRFVIRSIWE